MKYFPNTLRIKYFQNPEMKWAILADNNFSTNYFLSPNFKHFQNLEFFSAERPEKQTKSLENSNDLQKK